MTIILETIHGSHLYGLNHAGSDVDIFRVVEGARHRGRHTVTEEFDTTRVSLPRFMENVFKGSHQSVEALFSPLATIDPRYAEMFSSIRVQGADVFWRYRRTIHSFSHGDLKKRRHAVRLGLNLADLKQVGRFNPQLSEEQKDQVHFLAGRYSGEELFNICINL